MEKSSLFMLSVPFYYLDFRIVYPYNVLMKTAPLCFYVERPERNQRGVVAATWLQRASAVG